MVKISKLSVMANGPFRCVRKSSTIISINEENMYQMVGQLFGFLKQSKKNTIEQEYYINLVSIMFRIVRN